MAPLPMATVPSIRDLTLSSLELDSRSSPIDLPTYLSTLSFPELESLNNPPAPETPETNPLTKRTLPSTTTSSHILQPRTPQNPHPPSITTTKPGPPSFQHGTGSVPPNAINMKGIQALFAIIGASFVLAAIWFFFWAKNGGFQWRKGDWEDYKSTVLRRKGPDGKTLSNATKSTRLGGGSVVAGGYSDDGDGMTIITGTGTEMTGGSEAPIFLKTNEKVKGKKRKDKQSKGLRGGGGAEKKNKIHEKLRTQQKQERWEGGFDDDVRAYRHEKPARVGGLNRDSDAMFYGTDYSETEPTAAAASSYVSHRSSDRQKRDRESGNVNGVGVGRRDFSYGQDQSFTAAPAPTPAAPASRPKRYSSPSKPATPPRSARYSVPGSYASYTEPLDFDAQSQSQGTETGTKSYHHPIPGLSGKGGGFRAEGRGRGRRDSLDDSD